MARPELMRTAVAMLGVLALAGCASKPVEVVETRPGMSTEVMVRAIGPSEAIAQQAAAAAWKEMELCAALLDRRREGSEAWRQGEKTAREDPAQRPSDVWRINRDAGQFHTEVDPLVATCLGAAREVWTMSGGAFDPTVGPLVDLWREAAERNRLPADDQIAKARALVGMDKVEIMIASVQKRPDEMEFAAPDAAPARPQDLVKTVHSVGLRAGMRLDLGGIAKGYIAGRMARRMRQAGAIAGLVAAAGDVYAFGERPENLARQGGDRRWGVAVLDPRHPDDRSRAYAAIHVRDKAVDTSGHYYRGYAIEGRRYSHILDPRTGRPVDTRLASVTVVADDAAVSDALATAIAVLGVKDGLALVEKTEGVECLLIEAVLKEGQELQASGAPPHDADLVAHRSKGFAALEFKPEGLPPEP